MNDEVSKQIPFKIPLSLHRRIKVIAAEYRIGMSELVTKILDAKIRQFEEHLKNKEQT